MVFPFFVLLLMVPFGVFHCKLDDVSCYTRNPRIVSERLRELAVHSFSLRKLSRPNLIRIRGSKAETN